MSVCEERGGKGHPEDLERRQLTWEVVVGQEREEEYCDGLPLRSLKTPLWQWASRELFQSKVSPRPICHTKSLGAPAVL